MRPAAGDHHTMTTIKAWRSMDGGEAVEVPAKIVDAQLGKISIDAGMEPGHTYEVWVEITYDGGNVLKKHMTTETTT